MALTDENNMVMPVAPMNYGNSGGGFGFGGDWAWILLLLVLGGGWGGFGGFGMGGAGAMLGMGMFDGGFGLYPWLNNSQNINDGFRDQALNTTVNGIQNAVVSGFGDVQLGIAGVNQNICQTGSGITNAVNQGFANTNLGMCQGFNGVNNSIFGAQTAISNQLNSNELANLERSFAAQAANTAGLTNISTQLANCCCENRQATADLKYTVATENCADRYEAAQNTQSIIAAITAGIQSIKDDLCADRLDAERRENQNLRTQLSMAQLAASQVEQTAQLRASQATTANQLVAELRSCPIPAQPVYGNQPIFTCNGNSSCNCGSL